MFSFIPGERYEVLQKELGEAQESNDKGSIRNVIEKIDSEFFPEEIPAKDREKLEKIRNSVAKVGKLCFSNVKRSKTL